MLYISYNDNCTLQDCFHSLKFVPKLLKKKKGKFTEKYRCSAIKNKTELYFEIEKETQKGNGKSRHTEWILGLKAKS